MLNFITSEWVIVFPGLCVNKIINIQMYSHIFFVIIRIKNNIFNNGIIIK